MSLGYRGRRMSPLRLILLAVVVLITGIATFGFGRRQQVPEMQAALTTEPWAAGDIGGMTFFPVPQSMADLVATADDLVGQAPAVDLPQGVLIPKNVLTAPAEDLGDPNATLLEIPVRHDFWPGDGPGVGDIAVFGAAPGGCALLIQELRGAEGDTVILLVNPDTIARLRAEEGVTLHIWESPLNGWPLCEPEPVEVEEGEDLGADAEDRPVGEGDNG